MICIFTIFIFKTGLVHHIAGGKPREKPPSPTDYGQSSLITEQRMQLPQPIFECTPVILDRQTSDFRITPETLDNRNEQLFFDALADDIRLIATNRENLIEQRETGQSGI